MARTGARRRLERSDGEVEMDVKDALSADARIDSTNLHVEVANGVVRLGGSVPSFAMKNLARLVVERIKGVRDVEDRVVVEPLLPRLDADITADVVTGLMRDSLVDAPQVEVTTREGVVILRGVVDSYTERKAAEDVVRGVRGVVGIVNELRVVRTEWRADDEIFADVRRSLEQNLRLDPSSITVEVNEGVVRLVGTVPVPAQRWLADELVRWTPGVVDVVNELTTPPAPLRE